MDSKVVLCEKIPYHWVVVLAGRKPFIASLDDETSFHLRIITEE